MKHGPHIHFEPLQRAHLSTLHRWLQQPHVREFWDDGDRTLEQVQAHYFAQGRGAEGFLIVLDGQAAGYIQAYPVEMDSEYAGGRGKSGATCGIDLLIGELGWLGRGLAAPIIRAFAVHLHRLWPELRRVLIDPELRNERARHVYRQAGFRPLGRTEANGKAVEVLAMDYA